MINAKREAARLTWEELAHRAGGMPTSTLHRIATARQDRIVMDPINIEPLAQALRMPKQQLALLAAAAAGYPVFDEAETSKQLAREDIEMLAQLEQLVKEAQELADHIRARAS